MRRILPLLLNFRPGHTKSEGIGPLLLFKKNFAVQQVLRGGTWKPQSTISFCLRDVIHRSMDTFSIDPVVAAQQVV